MNTNRLGILERVLIRRYGQPRPRYKRGLPQKVWRADTPFVSHLYYTGDWTRPPAADFRVHQPIYGTSCGGTLLGDSLKVAMPSYETRFEIYNLRQLAEQMEVLALDPELAFFMHAAGVWYYGHKHGRLFVYDLPFEELDDLGPIEPALEEVIERWDEATKSVEADEGPPVPAQGPEKKRAN